MRIALLIDADNTQLPKMPAVLEQLSALGEVPIRLAFGNWSKEQLRSWMDATARLAVRQVQQPDYVSGKNATDIALVIAAMDILHSRDCDTFAIVSSDSDFTPLALHLREAGRRVLGFGQKFTPESFRCSCHDFTHLEDLPPHVEPARIISLPSEPQPPQPPAPRPVQNLDDKIIHMTLHKTAELSDNTEGGFTPLAEAGVELHALYPQHKLKFAGYAKLQGFLDAHAELYAIRKQRKIVYYRCLCPHADSEQAPSAPGKTSAEPPSSPAEEAPAPCTPQPRADELPLFADQPEQAASPTVPARVHIWLRRITEESLAPEGFASMGHTGYHLHKMAREEGSDFNVKHYGHAKLVNLIRSFPTLYELREEKRNGTTLYAYRCIHRPQRLT